MELIPATANRLRELLGTGDVSLGEVSRRNLGLHLDLGIWGDQLIGDLAALQDLDASIHNRVVLHVGHGHEPVNFGDAEPVQHIGHQGLETHVLDTGHILGAGKVG